MKALVLFLSVGIALVCGFPGKLPVRSDKPVDRAGRPREFEDWKVGPTREKKHEKGSFGVGMGKHQTMVDTLPSVRWCVTSLCEMKKCKRMATEFNYMVSPRLRWSCVLEKSKEACMKNIKNGQADVMMAEGEEIYKGGKVYDTIPIMVEKYKDSDTRQKHYSIVLVKKSNANINTFSDMAQQKSCHLGMDTMASFKSPVCSLIKEGIVPKVGNLFESAGDFFKESCVPGVQHVKYNYNMTIPESLCKLCKGLKSDTDFCTTLSDKEPFYGYTGALKCLREGHGDVGFFHTYDIMKNFDELSSEFDIVCKTKRMPLDWKNVEEANCHLAEEHPQALMICKNKPKAWIDLFTTAFKDAVKKFSLPDPKRVQSFSLFDSSPYCPTIDDEAESGDDTKVFPDGKKWKVQKWMKTRDLIFKDYSSSLETLPKEKRTYEFLGADTLNIWKTCDQLIPKPRAFFCVVGGEEMEKCKTTIDAFQTIEDVRRNISWGCVKASSKKECVEMVAKNLADIVDLNATEVFLAGMDRNLVPFIGKNFKGKDPWTKSITIGVKLIKEKSDLSEDMSGWKMCSAGIHKISGFVHPMGWLLANGTIERSSSPLKSIVDHFGESCIPGMKSVDLIKHHLFSRTFDWGSLLQGIKWEDWYKTPLWTKWQEKEDGAVNDYVSMHDVHDFHSPEFQEMLKMILSEDPQMHYHHTPEIHEMMEKVKQDFSWDQYDGLKDFYGLKKPSWKMISWIWEKPLDWTEMEWNLFKSWAEYLWDQEEDWELHLSTWKDGAWDVFKKWIDHEYNDFKKDHSPLHKDIFTRLSLLSDRFHWLVKQWKGLQWDNINIKHYREKLCEVCAGQGDSKCSMDSNEDYYDYEGSLKCLKEGDGDVAFMDWYSFDDALKKNSYSKDDFVLLCPDGKTVQEIGVEAVKECNFGHVRSNALVTCNMHDAVWRWKVTKALLHAQKILPLKMFHDGILGAETENLSPISLINQTYQVWLGPMFLSSIEGIIKLPDIETKTWQDEVDIVRVECDGEECDHDYHDLPSCDECAEGDMTCTQKCWDVKPFVGDLKIKTLKRRTGKTDKKRMKKMMQMGEFGGDWITLQKLHKMTVLGTTTTSKKPEIMLWKPEGLKMHSMTHHLMLMSHKETRSPMMKKMKVMMDDDKFIGPVSHNIGQMMHGMGPDTMPDIMDKIPFGRVKDWMKKKGKMVGHPHFTKDKIMHFQGEPNHHLETGPIMRSQESIRGEFYTDVIFTRNGTCNTIVHDLRCFGEKKDIQMWAGRVSKTLISVPMCPRPTDVKKTTAQFTCNTGASFIKSIYLPVRCSYVPCNPGFWVPDWTNDQFWDQDNSYPGDYWGNKEWRKLDRRGENDNWFLANQDENRVEKKPWGLGAMKWPGQDWRTI